jgi:chromosome segregation ATPase
MKNIILAITLVVSGFATAQTDEGLFEVEYELNGQQLKSFAFTTDNCSASIITKSWNNWVANKGGSVAFLKKHEANNIQFKNSKDVYKSILNLVEEENGKTTVINTLTDQNGMQFTSSSPEYNVIFGRLQDLGQQTKQACIRNDLRLANENMIKLTKENADAQSKKGNSIKSYLKDSNSLLKLETKKQLLGEKLELVTNQLEQQSDEKSVESLMKKKLKSESSLKSIEDQVVKLNAQIQTSEENNKGLDEKINQLTTQIQQQRTITENLKKKYSTIAR